MNCEEFRTMLDAYIDGELSGAEIAALRGHAKDCEACREELEAADMLRETMEHMDDDIVVPLEAQVAWRSAVRAEARKKNMRKWTRMAYAAAAALVLVFGVSIMLEKDAQQPMMLAAGDAIIARDGVAAGADEAPADYTVRKKISSDAPEEAIQSLQMLTAEYSGTCSGEGGDVLRIELPGEYLQDFLKAAERIGTEMDSEIVESEAETAVILIQISAE